MRWRDHHRRPDRLPPGAVLASMRGVAVTHADRPVVEGVDLDVRAGEVVAVVGPNGAGKSTVLRALCGDAVRAAGEVRVAGAPLGDHSVGELARLRALLPQQVTVAFPFTVDAVVRMGLAPWAGLTSPVDDEATVHRAMADCDVAHLAERTYPTLSGGEQARVSLARVLVQQTQLLLLDEPLAALDLRHQDQVLSVLRRRADAGDGVVVVLHDLTAAAADADRVVLLHRGRVVADGPPDRTLRPDLLADVYQHAVDVFPNPTTGALTVVPHRERPGPRPPLATAGRTGVP